MLRQLTRPELDALMADMEKADANCLQAICDAPLLGPELEERAGVGVDVRTLWQEALHESMWRWWHGEPLA
jgi:hypothetical protein